MAKFEISVNDEIQGIYEAETAFRAVQAFAKDVGIEEPKPGDGLVHGNSHVTYFDWGPVFTVEDYEKGEILSTNKINQHKYSAGVREVEAADLEEFIVPHYQTGSEIFGALMDEDKDVRYDIDNDQYVFYDGAKNYWEKVHDDVARSEQLKKILAEELNADMSKINEKLDEECAGINDLDELEMVKRAVLEDIYEHWND